MKPNVHDHLFQTGCLLMYLFVAEMHNVIYKICTYHEIFVHFMLSSCRAMLQDRPSTKVQAAPGGGSSLDYLFSGGKDGKWCHLLLVQPWAWKKGSCLTKNLVFPWVTIKLLMVCMLLGLLVCVHAFVCVVCWSAATGTKSWPLPLLMELGVTTMLTLLWAMFWCIKLFQVVFNPSTVPMSIENVCCLMLTGVLKLSRVLSSFRNFSPFCIVRR